MDKDVKWTSLVLAVLLTALSGCRRANVVDGLSEEDESGLARKVSRRMQKDFGGAGLAREQVRRCLTNAFCMARERALLEATCDVIPLYCLLSDGKGDEDILGGEGNRFVLDVWGCGARKAWDDDVADAGDDAHRIWLVFESFNRTSRRYTVVSSSLENLEHGMSSSWSGGKDGGVGGYGSIVYRCNDLLLGLEREPGSWIGEVAEGESRLYFLLGDARRFGFRIGRVVHGESDWRRRVDSLKAQGLLVEMVPLARSAGGCFLECR